MLVFLRAQLKNQRPLLQHAHQLRPFCEGAGEYVTDVLHALGVHLCLRCEVVFWCPWQAMIAGSTPTGDSRRLCPCQRHSRTWAALRVGGSVL